MQRRFEDWPGMQSKGHKLTVMISPLPPHPHTSSMSPRSHAHTHAPSHPCSSCVSTHSHTPHCTLTPISHGQIPHCTLTPRSHTSPHTPHPHTPLPQGRAGKGSIYVWAAGNGGSYYDSCAADGYSSSVYTISIGSANQYGRQADYDEQCSSKMAVTFSYNSLTFPTSSSDTFDPYNQVVRAGPTSVELA